jgi:thioesterase domain-containing protein
MPLFHIHGLVGAALSSLAAGGSLVCAPGFYAPRFFTWMREFQPTWYTAVPTMHQSILIRGEANREIIARHSLRFVRSSSAALPPGLMTGLESAFQVPVIESYGMTEAAHQMASNPLPPARRKPGSVGVPSGPEIAIIDEAGAPVPSGGKGEIVIRGDNVTPGYENNPPANQSGFTNGWFRTGDQGYFDSEGYLYITGRLKEVINRGGEKISPREVDEILLDHPDILEGVAFAVPHAQLGEDVGAAVVPRENASLTETQVRAFVSTRLADFKVPRMVRIVDEIPKGPTGKLQRFGLAEELNVQPIDETRGLDKAEFARPRTSLESRLFEIWRELLAIAKIGIHDNFFSLGGDSVLATLLMSRVSDLAEVNLPFVRFLDDPTIAAMAHEIENLRKEEAESGPRSSQLVAIQPDGGNPPLFCVGGHAGNLLGYCNLARHLGQDQPLFGFPLHRLLEEKVTYRLEDLAAWCIEDMRAFQPEGPYFLVGSCFGGVVTFEMARQLHLRGQQVALLAMVECFNHKWTQTLPLADLLGHKFRHFFRRSTLHLEHLAQLRPKDQLSYLRQRIGAVLRSMKERTGQRIYAFYARTGKLMPRFFREARYANRQVQREYVPKRYPGSAVLFRTTAPRPAEYPAPEMGWEGRIGGEVEMYDIPSYQLGVLEEPTAEVVAEHLQQSLEKARAVVAAQR